MACLLTPGSSLLSNTHRSLSLTSFRPEIGSGGWPFLHLFQLADARLVGLSSFRRGTAVMRVGG